MKNGEIMERGLKSLSDEEFTAHREEITKTVKALDALCHHLAVIQNENASHRGVIEDFDRNFPFFLRDFTSRVYQARNAMMSHLSISIRR